MIMPLTVYNILLPSGVLPIPSAALDSGDAILGAGRLLLRLWEAAGRQALPLATVDWLDRGPRLSWLIRVSCSGI